MLAPIAKLRNDVFHHRPIWKLSLNGLHVSATEILGWINPELKSLVVCCDRSRRSTSGRSALFGNRCGRVSASKPSLLHLHPAEGDRVGIRLAAVHPMTIDEVSALPADRRQPDPRLQRHRHRLPCALPLESEPVILGHPEQPLAPAGLVRVPSVRRIGERVAREVVELGRYRLRRLIDPAVQEIHFERGLLPGHHEHAGVAHAIGA